jgi:hypothetical protein
MPDYSKAKIYRIFCEDDEYIGSTTRQLSERMAQHRTGYKHKTSKCTSCVLFDKYGVDNCKIELIEDFPCERKEQLDRREGELQRERNCINKNIAGRTLKEWYQNNKEQIANQHKEYREENKEHIKDYFKTYHEQNKEKKNAYSNKYYENNKEKIRARQTEYRLKQKLKKESDNNC